MINRVSKKYNVEKDFLLSKKAWLEKKMGITLRESKEDKRTLGDSANAFLDITQQPIGSVIHCICHLQLSCFCHVLYFLGPLSWTSNGWCCWTLCCHE